MTEVIERAEKKCLVGTLDEEMDDKWIEEFLFPEKLLESSGSQPLDFDYIHQELAKPIVTLSHYIMNMRQSVGRTTRFLNTIAALFANTVAMQISIKLHYIFA